MPYSSILNNNNCDESKKEKSEEPTFFKDLNLDQIINDVTLTKKHYNLKPFFYTQLHDVETIVYRQEIAKDLENQLLMTKIKEFSKKMITVRQYLSLVSKLYYKYHKDGWYLEAIKTYCNAVNNLYNDLLKIDLNSRGLVSFREYLKAYVESENFTKLFSETEKIKASLASIKYCINIKGNTVKVRKYESEIDYSIEVLKTFERFKQGDVNDYRIDLPITSGMNHVEAQILDLVAKLYPEIFSKLHDFCTKNTNFQDKKIITFDREIQFYVSYLDYISSLRGKGLRFHYPEISSNDKSIYNYEGFDLALAMKLIAKDERVVCNDFYLENNERIFVVSGPNQGGKTTFARMFGQLHYLASLGLPVPGVKGKLFLFDRIFTHFEKEENIKNLRGKLQDDLLRIYDILNNATSNSIIIINEIFSSTTLKDAIFLGEKVMEEIIDRDSLCVFVTFLVELASISEKIVSMVSTVNAENPVIRTYKIVRKHADGLVYAMAIADKYRLTYNWLKERIKI